MQRVANFRGPIFGCATMAHYKPRFRISIKDLATGKKLTVELVPGLWRGHFSIRQNGRRAPKVPTATTSQVFARLRSWVARQPQHVPEIRSPTNPPSRQ